MYLLDLSTDLIELVAKLTGKYFQVFQ